MIILDQAKAHGCIHGRFQPFHWGHERYAIAALELCDYLWIGLTQYDLNSLVECNVDQHREQKENNPFSYLKRCEMIYAWAEQIGCSDRIGFSPFPIDEPFKLKNFISPNITCFTTKHSNWNNVKIKRLLEEGYKVQTLLDPDNSETASLSGTHIAILNHFLTVDPLVVGILGLEKCTSHFGLLYT